MSRIESTTDSSLIAADCAAGLAVAITDCCATSCAAGVAISAQSIGLVEGATVRYQVSLYSVPADDVTVSNTDDDSAGVTVDAASDLTTTEGGGTASFTVVLNAEPNSPAAEFAAA